MNALEKEREQPAAEKLITVQTSRFGEITIDQDRVITMTSPFLGFPESKRFILRPHGPDSPFMWLQSLDNPDLAFVVIRAGLLGEAYDPQVPGPAMKELEISGASERDMLLILTIPKGKPEDITANLLGPLLINTSKRLAKQVVLDPNKYDPCWPLFQK